MQRSLIRPILATRSAISPVPSLFRRQVIAMTYSSFKFKVTGKASTLFIAVRAVDADYFRSFQRYMHCSRPHMIAATFELQ